MKVKHLVGFILWLVLVTYMARAVVDAFHQAPAFLGFILLALWLFFVVGSVRLVMRSL